VPLFLNLGTGWRWVVSFTPWPLYPGDRAPVIYWLGAGLDRRLRENSPNPARNQTLVVQLVAKEKKVMSDSKEVVPLWISTGLFRYPYSLIFVTVFTSKCVILLLNWLVGSSRLFTQFIFVIVQRIFSYMIILMIYHSVIISFWTLVI
jgi:hypothetical protein